MAKSKKKVTRKKAKKTSSTSGSSVTPSMAYKAKIKRAGFSSASEMKDAQKEIRAQEWKKLERASARRELLQEEEFNFVLESFHKGFECDFNGGEGQGLVKVYLSKEGTQRIEINEELKNAENMQSLIGVLIKSMGESFHANYLKALAIIPPDDSDEDEANTELKKLLKRYMKE